MKCPYDVAGVVKDVRKLLEDPDFVGMLPIEDMAFWMIDVIADSDRGIYQANQLLVPFDIDLEGYLDQDDAAIAGYEDLGTYIAAIYSGDEHIPDPAAFDIVNDINVDCDATLNKELIKQDLPGHLAVEWVGDLGLVYTVDGGDFEDWLVDAIPLGYMVKDTDEYLEELRKR